MRNYILQLQPVPDPKSKRERQLGALITPDALTCFGADLLLDCACCRTRRWQQPSRHNCRWRDGGAPGHGQWYANLEREGILKALFNQIPAFIVPRTFIASTRVSVDSETTGPLSYVPALSLIVLSPPVDWRLPRLKVSHAAIAPTEGGSAPNVVQPR
jgi:hypothetical protein